MWSGKFYWFSLFFCLFAFTMTGCTVKHNITLQERETIKKVALIIEESVDFNVTGAAGGAFEGAFKGFLYGLHPGSWVYGGPLTMPLVGLIVGAECKKEFDSIENPKERFLELIRYLNLPTRLEKEIIVKLDSDSKMSALSVEALSCVGQKQCLDIAKCMGFDALLELTFHIQMSATRGTIEGEERCAARLGINVLATLRRVYDSTVIARSAFYTDSYKSSNSPPTFKQILGDESVMAQIVLAQVERIAEWVAEWMSGSEPFKN